MATTATTTTDHHPVRWSFTRPIGFLTAAAIVVAGLAVWTGNRVDGQPADHTMDAAAITAGLSQELLADELTAIRVARGSGAGSTTAAAESGLSQELLAEELAAIRRTATMESGLSQELLAEELAAIRGQ